MSTSPYAIAPAPWTTKGEMYWLLISLPKPLSPSIYNPLEARTTDDFKGGFAYIQIIRYTETPVGPYDELMILPGDFQTPKGEKKLRITRIYVSQKDTIYNGRKNWNIPKHLARFEFSHPITPPGSSPPKELSVSVYPPSPQDARPFFSATLTPSTWFPGFPVSTRYLKPIMHSPLVQPPLPTGEDFLVGTEKWKSFEVKVWSNRARLMGVKVDMGATVEQEAHWPQSKAWSLGLWLQDGTAFIEEPEEFTV